MYESLGVSRAVYEYGEMILDGLRPRFEAIDRTAEYNQTKVLAAMQKNKLSAGCFAATTGYGYDDMGREVLEKVYAVGAAGAKAAVHRQVGQIKNLKGQIHAHCHDTPDDTLGTSTGQRS